MLSWSSETWQSLDYTFRNLRVRIPVLECFWEIWMIGTDMKLSEAVSIASRIIVLPYALFFLSGVLGEG